MNNTNTGGPAFPMNWVKQEAPNLNVILEQRGMTLRDYFAAKAMTMFEWSMMTQSDGKNIMDSFAADRCYMVADAMLSARNTGKRGNND
jgi:hypothetical protein